MPPSTVRVFDFIGVPLYFGLSMWNCMSFVNLRCFANLMMSTNFSWKRGELLHHQRVVFLISYASPSTLAYWFGFVSFVWAYVFSQLSFCPFICSTNSYNCLMNTRWTTPPSMCRVFDFIGVSLYFGLHIWICMSFLHSRFSDISIVH